MHARAIRESKLIKIKAVALKVRFHEQACVKRASGEIQWNADAYADFQLEACWLSERRQLQEEAAIVRIRSGGITVKNNPLSER
jgi:hypothetical protein